MRYLWFILVLVLSAVIVRAQATWTRVSVLDATTPSRVFIFGDTVIIADIAGIGALFVSTNNGVSWTKKSYPNPPDLTWGQFFLDSRHGWAIGSTSGGHYWMYRTTDGGSSWNRGFQFPDGAFGPLLHADEMQFVDTNVGYVKLTSGFGPIYKTSDGGTTFSVADNASDAAGLSFADANVGWSAGFEPEACRSDVLYCIRRTMDGGATWQDLPTPFSQSTNFQCVRAFSADVCWAGGGMPHLVRTLDGSAATPSWQKVTMPPGMTFARRIQILSARDVWVLGGGDSGTAIAGTQEGDKTSGMPGWKRYPFPSDIRDFCMRSIDTGWAVGSNGAVYRTPPLPADVVDKDREDVQSTDVRLTPNPASEVVEVSIRASPALTYDIRLCDLLGRTIDIPVRRSHVSNAGTAELRLQGLAPGFYVVRVVLGDVSLVRMLSVVR